MPTALAPLARVHYAVRDTVPVSGDYLCLPCGYIQFFEAGDQFTECLACLAGTAMGPLGYQNEADDFWQPIS